MHSTQVSVWEIQHPNTLCQSQDTVELQEIPLGTITETSLAQEIRTMIDMVETVHNNLKVPGGMVLAMIQTSTVSTMVDHTPPMLMV